MQEIVAALPALAGARLLGALGVVFFLGLAIGSLITSAALDVKPAEKRAPTAADLRKQRENRHAWIAGIGGAIALLLLLGYLTAEDRRLDFAERMRLELAAHSIVIRDACPPPAPGLSNTLTLVLNDEELETAPTIETFFRIKQRGYPFPAETTQTIAEVH